MSIFHLPDLGEGLAEAEIRGWYIHEGDEVKTDQPMLSVETAKAVVDIPAPQAGRIKKLYGNPGDIIKIGAPLVEFEGENKDTGTVVGNLEQSHELLKETEMKVGVEKSDTITVKAMPQVRQLAKTLNIDITHVTPTGQHGQITEEDVKAAAQNTSTVASTQETLKGPRRAMAMAIESSHRQVVPVTLMDDADITNLPDQQDITVRLMQAMIHAVQQESSLNAWYEGQKFKRVLHASVDLGLAIDTEEGLFVPVIKKAETLNAIQLRVEIDRYKAAVQNRSIKPDELKGATITLTNFGLFAGRYATPMIIPPMVAIVGCGRVREAPYAHQGTIALRTIAPLSLTFDHRAVTGGEAARFLKAVIHHLEGLA